MRLAVVNVRTTQRRLAVLLVVAGGLVWLLGTAAPSAHAQFTEVRAVVTVYGAGTVGAPGLSCDTRSNLDDRVQRACGVASLLIPGAVFFQMPISAAAAASPPGHWEVSLNGQPCDGVSGTATQKVCMINAVPGNSVIRNIVVRFDDKAGPAVNPGSPVFSATTDRTISLPLPSNEPGTFECAFDGGSFRPCTNATPFTLTEGPHTVTVRGRDRSGNLGATSSPVGFQILDTRLLTAPRSFSPTKSAAFRFSTLTGFSFDCALDGAPLADCGTKLGDNTLTKSFSNLSEGSHTFTVRARNGSDIDHVPVRRTWTVDTVAPNTGLDPLVGPRDGEVSTLLTAAFKMSASEPATIQCRLDGAPFANCPATRSFANLGFGQHRFQARTIDRAGNIDATPISRTWTVLAVDNDGDGFNQRSDCDDTSPVIRPGAREVAGNDVDENCDGFKAPPPRMTSTTVPNSWSVLGKRATLTRLQIKRLRAGARVEIRCLGKRCPFKRVKAKGKPKRGTLNLMKSLKGKRRKFRAGQTLEIRITAPRVIGKVVRYRIRAGEIPKARELCLPPGTRRPVKCA